MDNKGSKANNLFQKIGWWFGLLFDLIETGKKYNDKNRFPNNNISTGGSDFNATSVEKEFTETEGVVFESESKASERTD
jgi:hypothetical protein